MTKVFMFSEAILYLSMLQDLFSISVEYINYTVFKLSNILYDFCMIFMNSYMIFVKLLRIHTNHILTSTITKNPICYTMVTKNHI